MKHRYDSPIWLFAAIAGVLILNLAVLAAAVAIVALIVRAVFL